MSKVSIIESTPGVFSVSGELTFASINKDTIKSFAFLKKANPVVLDFGQITNTDSAGLALVIEWLKYAYQNHIEVKLHNLPKQLLTLAKLSGLDKTSYFSGLC